jgi:hypothetical protein
MSLGKVKKEQIMTVCIEKKTYVVNFFFSMPVQHREGGIGSFLQHGEKIFLRLNNVVLELQIWWKVYFNMGNRAEMFPRPLADGQKVVSMFKTVGLGGEMQVGGQNSPSLRRCFWFEIQR